MTKALAVVTPAAAPLALPKDLLADWWDGKSKRTVTTYKAGIEAFRQFLNAESALMAINQILMLPHGQANLLALQFKNWLKARKLAPATINVRLNALRSIVELAYAAGSVAWTLKVKGERSKTMKDVRGPGIDAINAMFAYAAKQQIKYATRNTALLYLLFGQGLRREEVSSLNVADMLPDGRLAVMRKGYTERVLMDIAPGTLAALGAWLKVRGNKPGPLIMSYGNLYRTVKMLGKKCGVVVWPHGLRHTAGSTVAAKSNGSVLAVKEFLGHADSRTSEKYIHGLEGLAAKGAAMVVGEITK